MKKVVFGHLLKRPLSLHFLCSLMGFACIFYGAEIENTSWKVLAYGIYARVVDVSEIERVSAANE